jgi:DNA-binding transcriptional LysR family regulator
MPDKKRTEPLDWEDVRYFVAMARNGTISATARALRVNHATVARRIASLETLFGRALFDRRAKGYVLTAEGKAVFGEANAMDEAALAVLRRLDAGTELSGRVRLAAGRVLAERFLIDRLRTFHERRLHCRSRVARAPFRRQAVFISHQQPDDASCCSSRGLRHCASSTIYRGRA